MKKRNWKLFYFFLIVLTSSVGTAQEKEVIKIPNGVVYNYCDPKIVEKAKKMIEAHLTATTENKLLDKLLIVGPVLWERLKDNQNIQKIEKGDVTFHVDDKLLKGKMTQDKKDTKIIWDEFRKEVTGDYIIRKANEEELRYYWSVISFDIDEPLLILETKEHNYILNILKKDLKLMWLDEAPRSSK